MLNQIKKFLRSEKGAETVEYVAIAAVIVGAGALAYSNADISSVVSAGVADIISTIANPSGG